MSRKVTAKEKEHLVGLLRMELSRRSLWHFCLYMDEEFFKARPFLKQVADAMQEIEEGTVKSLSVSMPPRAGKSYITSLFCAWVLGRNPTESIMRNTCTATLYVKFSYDVRAVIQSTKYKQVFPSVRLSDDKKNLQGWNTNSSRQVGYFGAGVGGTIIGFGATKVAITDDLYRGIEDALSDTVNDRIHQWKQSTHDSRFETGCARIDIGTRWSLNDVIGRNMGEGVYQKSIVIPALNEEGESFCEAVMTTDEFMEKRKRTSPEIWQAEYMQEPVDIKGRLFGELKYIEEADFEALIKDRQVDGAIAYIDVADQGADYTAMAVAVMVANELFIVDHVYTKDNTDITLPLCAGLLNKWKVKYCRVESNSMGAMFARQLQGLTDCKVLQVANQVNKMTRIIMQSVFIQQRMTFVRRENNPQVIQFVQNVLSFSKEGKNKHDDAPDCMAGLSIFLQSLFKNL
jgi:predicted phage terminase large subunit-like protein